VLQRKVVTVLFCDVVGSTALAREAVAISERTDALLWQGDAGVDLAEVLVAAGQADEARTALEVALDCYERKKSLVMAERVRGQLG